MGTLPNAYTRFPPFHQQPLLCSPHTPAVPSTEQGLRKCQVAQCVASSPIGLAVKNHLNLLKIDFRAPPNPLSWILQGRDLEICKIYAPLQGNSCHWANWRNRCRAVVTGMGRVLRRGPACLWEVLALCLTLCVSVLKLRIIFNQGALHFHFVLHAAGDMDDAAKKCNDEEHKLSKWTWINIPTPPLNWLGDF